MSGIRSVSLSITALFTVYIVCVLCVGGGGGGGGGEGRRVISVWLSIQVDFFFCLVIDSSGLFLLFSYRFKWAFSSVWLSVHVFFPLFIWLSIHVFFSLLLLLLL